MTTDITTLEAGTDFEAADPADLDAGERRARRARVERMLVLPHRNHEGVCGGVYTVITAGGEYVVELDASNACTCPDATYNRPEGGCKHRRRVAISIGETTLPAPGDSVSEYVNETLPRLKAELKEARDAADAAALAAAIDDDERATGDAVAESEILSKLIERIDA